MIATEPRPNRRVQMSSLIDELIQERQQVWSLYCKVADMKPFTSEQPIQNLLNEFCQILIDYISLGHFGIYQRIIEGNERRNAVLRAAETIYPEIAETTEAAVSFNDKYVKPNNSEIIESLEQDLSILGEKLAQRIDAEDQLCSVMLH